MLERVITEEGEVAVQPDSYVMTLWRNIISMMYSHPTLLVHPGLIGVRNVFIDMGITHDAATESIFIPIPGQILPKHSLRPKIEYPEMPLQTLFGEILDFTEERGGITVHQFTVCDEMQKAATELREFIKLYPKALYDESYGFIYDFLIRFGTSPKVVDEMVENSKLTPLSLHEVAEEIEVNTSTTVQEEVKAPSALKEKRKPVSNAAPRKRVKLSVPESQPPKRKPAASNGGARKKRSKTVTVVVENVILNSGVVENSSLEKLRENKESTAADPVPELPIENVEAAVEVSVMEQPSSAVDDVTRLESEDLSQIPLPPAEKAEKLLSITKEAIPVSLSSFKPKPIIIPLARVDEAFANSCSITNPTEDAESEVENRPSLEINGCETKAESLTDTTEKPAEELLVEVVEFALPDELLSGLNNRRKRGPPIILHSPPQTLKPNPIVIPPMPVAENGNIVKESPTLLSRIYRAQIRIEDCMLDPILLQKYNLKMQMKQLTSHPSIVKTKEKWSVVSPSSSETASSDSDEGDSNENRKKKTRSKKKRREISNAHTSSSSGSSSTSSSSLSSTSSSSSSESDSESSDHSFVDAGAKLPEDEGIRQKRGMKSHVMKQNLVEVKNEGDRLALAENEGREKARLLYKESDGSGADSKNQVKRGRGRPRVNMPKVKAMNGSGAGEKRGRGRPRKNTVNGSVGPRTTKFRISFQPGKFQQYQDSPFSPLPMQTIRIQPQLSTSEPQVFDIPDQSSGSAGSNDRGGSLNAEIDLAAQVHRSIAAELPAELQALDCSEEFISRFFLTLKEAEGEQTEVDLPATINGHVVSQTEVPDHTEEVVVVTSAQKIPSSSSTPVTGTSTASDSGGGAPTSSQPKVIVQPIVDSLVIPPSLMRRHLSRSPSPIISPFFSSP